MCKKALITGIGSQDGSYLAEFLLAKGYEVHGVIPRPSGALVGEAAFSDSRAVDADLTLHHGDLGDAAATRALVATLAPDEVYHLAPESPAPVLFGQPEHACDEVGAGTLRLLEAVRQVGIAHGTAIRYYQAGSSGMFGAASAPQNEDSPFLPRCPHAAAKLAGHWYTRSYREAFNLFACTGICFNHESPRRDESFVTRRITRAVGRIAVGLQDALTLGNLEAKRDWGFAGDYVEAMWLMLQQPSPDDYVIASGESHSVKDFVEAAFVQVGLDWRKYVKIDARHFRSNEVDHLCGDSTKARARLRWKPRVAFSELVAMMVAHDLDLARQELARLQPPAPLALAVQRASA